MRAVPHNRLCVPRFTTRLTLAQIAAANARSRTGAAVIVRSAI